MSPLEKVRVLVVHQDPLTRLGILGLFQTHSQITSCGEAGDGRRARQLCGQERPDVIIVDLDVPNGGRLLLLRDLHRLHAPVRLIALGVESDTPSVLRAFQAGTCAYVLKNDSPKELLAAMEMVIGGSRFCSRCVTDSILTTFACGKKRPPSQDLQALSGREREVFELTARRLGTTAISRELGVSVKTIETHKRRIQEKLAVDSAKQLQTRAEQWMAGCAGHRVRAAFIPKTFSDR